MAVNVSSRMMNVCRFLLIVINVIFMFVALLVVGLSIYMLIYKGDLLAVIFEMPHLGVACIILIFCGSFLLILSIVGLSGALVSNKSILLVYVVLMALVGLLSIAAAIIGMVTRNMWYIDQLRLEMRNVLQQKYGTNMNNTQNKFLTQTWDTVQQFWYCCGVEDNSWGIFRQSQWYNDQPGDAGTKEFTAKMVPASCCVKNQYGNFVNLQKCQNWQLGPPNKQSGLDKNEAVFYLGCFTIGRGMLTDVANGLIGLGICLGVVMFVGAIAAFLLLMGLRNTKNYPTKGKKPAGFYVAAPQRHDGDRSGDRSLGQVSPAPVELQPMDRSW